MTKSARVPAKFVPGKYDLKGETWPEMRTELEEILETFFIKASNATRPDGIRLIKLDFQNSLFIDEANKLIDALETAYHSTGCVAFIPEGAQNNEE